MKKAWKYIPIMIVVLLICSAICFGLSRPNVILSRYAYIYTAQSIASSDGEYIAQVLILGEKAEDGAFPIKNPVNKSYDICVRLWFKPQKQSDGSIMWRDTNTKIIYFKKDCSSLDVEWIDNHIVIVNGKEIAV